MINIAKFKRVDIASICYDVQEVSSCFDSFVLVHVNREANILPIDAPGRLARIVEDVYGLIVYPLLFYAVFNLYVILPFKQ